MSLGMPWQHSGELYCALRQRAPDEVLTLHVSSENVEMISMGVYIYLILPTFYVSLPRSTYEQSTTVKGAISTLRIATAGIYHNLVLCAIVYLLQASGGGMSTRLTGWAYELVDGGISVSHIASVSHAYMPRSARRIVDRWMANAKRCE